MKVIVTRLGQSELSRYFDKISKHLPEFQCELDLDKGWSSSTSFSARLISPRRPFEYRAFTRLKQLQYLIRTGQLDQGFFWKTTF
jgi:hypothetical protein